MKDLHAIKMLLESTIICSHEYRAEFTAQLFQLGILSSAVKRSGIYAYEVTEKLTLEPVEEIVGHNGNYSQPKVISAESISDLQTKRVKSKNDLKQSIFLVADLRESAFVREFTRLGLKADSIIGYGIYTIDEFFKIKKAPADETFFNRQYDEYSLIGYNQIYNLPVYTDITNMNDLQRVKFRGFQNCKHFLALLQSVGIIDTIYSIVRRASYYFIEDGEIKFTYLAQSFEKSELKEVNPEQVTEYILSWIKGGLGKDQRYLAVKNETIKAVYRYGVPIYTTDGDEMAMYVGGIIDNELPDNEYYLNENDYYRKLYKYKDQYLYLNQILDIEGL